MSEPRYKVVVNGPAAGRDPEEVKTNLAAMYKGDVQRARIFFKGKPVVVKQNLDRTAALKYKAAFEKAGAAVKVVGTAATRTKSAKKVAPPSDKERMKCPKCGFVQDASPSCIKCGIVVDKFREARAEKEAPGSPHPAPESPLPPPVHPGMVVDEEDRDPVDFMTELPTVFTYPFSGVGMYVILASLVYLLVTRYIPFIGGILSLIGWGYVAAYAFRVIRETADAPDEPAPWPGMENFSADIIIPFFKMLWVNLVCFLPALLYMIFVAGVRAFLDPVFYILILLGAVYAPMAFLTVAMSGNFLALNPLVVVPSIIKVPIDYLICLAAFLVIVILNTVAERILALPIPVVGPAIQIALTLYVLVMEARILGLLYAANEEKLEWYV